MRVAPPIALIPEQHIAVPNRTRLWRGVRKVRAKGAWKRDFKRRSLNFKQREPVQIT